MGNRRRNDDGQSRYRLGLLLFSIFVTVWGIGTLTRSPARSAENDTQSIASPGPAVTPDPLMARSLAEKAEIEQRYEASRFQSQGALPPEVASRPADIEAIQNPVFKSGIIEGVAGPFNSFDVQVSNVWQEETEAGFIQIFAGVSGTDPQLGMLVLLLTSRDRLNSDEFRYPAPGAHGALRITEAIDPILSLSAEDGVRYTFDLRNRTYTATDATGVIP
jgi:hypothetical protein